jgi:hypothetical protein
MASIPTCSIYRKDPQVSVVTWKQRRKHVLWESRRASPKLETPKILEIGTQSGFSLGAHGRILSVVEDQARSSFPPIGCHCHSPGSSLARSSLCVPKDAFISNGVQPLMNVSVQTHTHHLQCMMLGICVEFGSRFLKTLKSLVTFQRSPLLS